MKIITEFQKPGKAVFRYSRIKRRTVKLYFQFFKYWVGVGYQKDKTNLWGIKEFHFHGFNITAYKNKS